MVLRQSPGHASPPRRRDRDGRPPQHRCFNDGTRAFAFIPSRHDVWRRVACDWLAGMIVTGVVDEDAAAERAHEFAHGLARKAYGLERDPAGRTAGKT